LKAIYGLQIASKSWHDVLDQDIVALGLQRSKCDRCVYYCVRGKKITLLATYVDDILLASNDNDTSFRIFDRLTDKYKLRISENPRCFIGIKLNWFDDRNSLDDLLPAKLFVSEIVSAVTPLIVCEDNISAHRKHFILICASQVHEAVENGDVNLVSVLGKDQLADGLTKPLGPVLFRNFRNFFLYELT